MLDEQIKAFALAAAPDAQAVALREDALQRIGAVVGVHLFGSAATGLALATSDLDLVICGPEASGRPHEVPSGLPASRGDLVADLREVAKALIAEGVADAIDLTVEVRDATVIQPLGCLIEQQYIGRIHQGTGQQNTLELSPREVGDLLLLDAGMPACARAFATAAREWRWGRFRKRTTVIGSVGSRLRRWGT